MMPTDSWSASGPSARVPTALAALEGTIVGDSLPMIAGLRRVQLTDPTLSVGQAIAAYRADPNVLYAEPDYRIQLQVLPNDPAFASLWGLNNTGQSGGTPDADIDAPEAWERHDRQPVNTSSP